MALREYTDCLFCDETKFVGRRYSYSYDEEKERYVLKERLYEARLQVDPEHMFAERLKSRNGIQVLWSHGSWFDDYQSFGRVLTMEFAGKKLVGDASLSEDGVLKYVAGGLDVVEKGINSGFSVGVRFLDVPAVSWQMRDGTREKPDQLLFGAVQIEEISLTPMPRLYTAGLGARKTLAEKERPTEEPTDG